MIAAGQADLAAIDCVTFAHLRHLYPQTIASLRVLGWTPSSPALPFITARSTSDTTVQALRTALKSTLADPYLAEIRASLHLVDVEIDLDPTPNFSEVLGLGRAAAERGYPTLA